MTSGILGKIHKWKNESTVSFFFCGFYFNSFDPIIVTIFYLLFPCLVKQSPFGNIFECIHLLHTHLIPYDNFLSLIIVIFFLSAQGIFKDKSKYPTLTRMSYCQCRLKLVFSSVFRQFNWKHVALLLDRSDLFSLTVGKNLEYGLKEEGLLAFVRELNGNEEESYDNYLRDASMYARVVILSVRGRLVRKFMLAAHNLGMTKGDFTFLDVEIFQSSYWGDHNWEMFDNDDSIARKAYESLLR